MGTLMQGMRSPTIPPSCVNWSGIMPLTRTLPHKQRKARASRTPPAMTGGATVRSFSRVPHIAARPQTGWGSGPWQTGDKVARPIHNRPADSQSAPHKRAGTHLGRLSGTACQCEPLCGPRNCATASVVRLRGAAGTGEIEHAGPARGCGLGWFFSGVRLRRGNGFGPFGFGS